MDRRRFLETATALGIAPGALLACAAGSARRTETGIDAAGEPAGPATPNPGGGGSGGGSGAGSAAGGADAASPGGAEAATRPSDGGGDLAAPADRSTATDGAPRDRGGADLGPASGIIDTHVHFWNPAEQPGLRWPEAGSELYRPYMPADYEKAGKPLGITGVVLVDSVWRPEDHEWAFRLAERNKLIVAVIGNLYGLSGSAFRDGLERYAKRPIFRGIRGGRGELAMTAGLALLVDKGLTLNLQIGADQLAKTAQVAGVFPTLRIVIDHMADVVVNGGSPPSAWIQGMNMLAARPNVMCKLSFLVEASGGRSDVNHYRPVLDHLWKTFGEDRLVFGSNWPVSLRSAPLATAYKVVATYVGEKGKVASDKVFFHNARAVFGL